MIADKSKGLYSQSSIEIPLDNHSINEEDITLDSKEFFGEEWTILDCHFGTPLFDVDCNTRICEFIVRDLCNDEKWVRIVVSRLPKFVLFFSFLFKVYKNWRPSMRTWIKNWWNLLRNACTLTTRTWNWSKLVNWYRSPGSIWLSRMVKFAIGMANKSDERNVCFDTYDR